MLVQINRVYARTQYTILVSYSGNFYEVPLSEVYKDIDNDKAVYFIDDSLLNYESYRQSMESFINEE